MHKKIEVPTDLQNLIEGKTKENNALMGNRLCLNTILK
jgi:hypothetical protein